MMMTSSRRLQYNSREYHRHHHTRQDSSRYYYKRPSHDNDGDDNYCNGFSNRIRDGSRCRRLSNSHRRGMTPPRTSHRRRTRHYERRRSHRPSRWHTRRKSPSFYYCEDDSYRSPYYQRRNYEVSNHRRRQQQKQQQYSTISGRFSSRRPSSANRRRYHDRSTTSLYKKGSAYDDSFYYQRRESSSTRTRRKRRRDEEGDNIILYPREEALTCSMLSKQALPLPPPPAPKGGGGDDEIVHFEWRPGQRLSKQFVVRGQLGEGTFGRVLECEDVESGALVAIKVVRDVSRYTSAAKIEAEILDEIKRRDPRRESNCVHLLDHFLFDAKSGRPCLPTSSRQRKGQRARQRRSSSTCHEDDDSLSDYGAGIHMCLASELLGLSLFAYLSQNNYRGYFMVDIQRITKHILRALAFLREIKLTHTDLKPENILFVNSTSEKVEFPRARHPPRFWDGDASDFSSTSSSRSYSSTSSKNLYRNGSNGHHCRRSGPRIVYTNRPLDCRIKLIDFGSATFEDDDHCSLINTRQYRAPEVILRWSAPSDLWSLGCILMELYTGMLLFRTHEHMEHLAMIEKIVEPIPINILKASINTDARKYVVQNINEIRLNWPEGASSKKSMKRVSKCRRLEEMVLPCHQLFAQFVRYLLVVDPDKRPTPQQALQHQFLHAILREY